MLHGWLLATHTGSGGCEGDSSSQDSTLSSASLARRTSGKVKSVLLQTTVDYCFRIIDQCDRSRDNLFRNNVCVSVCYFLRTIDKYDRNKEMCVCICLVILFYFISFYFILICFILFILFYFILTILFYLIFYLSYFYSFIFSIFQILFHCIYLFILLPQIPFTEMGLLLVSFQ